MTPSTFTAIPEVDLSPWGGSDTERAELGEQVREVCHRVGFFQLVGHGIDPAFIDEHIRQQARFFALSDDAKATIDKVASPHFRGLGARRRRAHRRAPRPTRTARPGH